MRQTSASTETAMVIMLEDNPEGHSCWVIAVYIMIIHCKCLGDPMYMSTSVPLNGSMLSMRMKAGFMTDRPYLHICGT